MTKTEQLQGLLAALVLGTAPHLAGRIDVAVSRAEKLFEARPHGARVVLTFGTQVQGHDDLMYVIEEAVLAAEQLSYGLTTAAAMQLHAREIAPAPMTPTEGV